VGKNVLKRKSPKLFVVKLIWLGVLAIFVFNVVFVGKLQLIAGVADVVACVSFVIVCLIVSDWFDLESWNRIFKIKIFENF